jgi:type II secretory pathway pseudopilin PulG
MALAKCNCSKSEAGFSIVEVLVATGLLAAALVALAELFVIATNANRGARATTMATTLAEQKIEQLRGLTWGFDTLGLPLTDTTSNITASPSTPSGGSGLSPSPANTLGANTQGFVDYLDGLGNWVGAGSEPPATAVYIRRWSIEPLPTNPNNTLVFQVLVTRVRDRGAANQGNVRRLPEEARMVSVKTRKST